MSNDIDNITVQVFIPAAAGETVTKKSSSRG